uniref:Uncharacterized protein n=1 Tax=Glossina palpalis gambiensis TaxID=67801 RepID=A0A1B0BLW5_9MUSC
MVESNARNQIPLYTSVEELNIRMFIKFICSYFTRYKYSRQQSVTPEYIELVGVNLKKPADVTIEREFEKIKKLDTENWENIREPRPWEENVD